MRHKIANRGERSFQVCVATFGTGEYAGKIEGVGIEKIEEGFGGRVVLQGEGQGVGWGMGQLAGGV